MLRSREWSLLGGTSLSMHVLLRILSLGPGFGLPSEQLYFCMRLALCICSGEGFRGSNVARNMASITIPQSRLVIYQLCPTSCSLASKCLSFWIYIASCRPQSLRRTCQPRSARRHVVVLASKDAQLQQMREFKEQMSKKLQQATEPSSNAGGKYLATLQ